MTDKEWNELWDFAEKQNVLGKVVDLPYHGYSKERFVIPRGFIFCKDGSIWCDSCGDTLIENRTPAQMKAIIKNLL